MKKDNSLEKKYEAYANAMQFARLKNAIVQDLYRGNKENSYIYKKYPKHKFLSWMDRPKWHERELRELSCYLYDASSHYRRLVDYFANILYYNYIIIPTNLSYEKNGINKKKYIKNYLKIVNLADKYNFERICRKMIKIAIRDGVFFGLCYESENSFFIQKFNSNYARIAEVEGGSFVYKMDLNYFSNKEYLLDSYGEEIKNAYYSYKGIKNIKPPNKSKRWFAPPNGICIKVDETDQVHSLPLFMGLLDSIYDIEDYKLLKKAKTENDNYIALAMKIPTDGDGVPLLDDKLTQKYYQQAAINLSDGIGLIMSPFDIKSFKFSDNQNSNTTSVIDAENEFWYASGVSPLIFGSTKATSSNALTLSVKPDEQIAYDLLLQIQNYFNNKIKKMDLPYGFKIKFSNQSIFNSKEIVDTYSKAATYGVSGAKLGYAQALGMSPSDVIGMSYLEDDILKVGKEMFVRPLISSNTLSSGKVDDESVGRPTNDSKNLPLTDKGEESKERSES